MASDSSRSGLGFILVLVLLLAAGGAWWFFANGNGQPNENGDPNENGTTVDNGDNGNGTDSGPKLSADDYAAAFEFSSMGLGYLENKNYIEGQSTFEALREKFPNESLPVRNLAITQTLMVTDPVYSLSENKRKDPEAWKQAATAARETLKDLEKSDAPFAKFLGGLISVADKQFDDGIADLTAAAEQAKDNPSYWLELYDVHANLRERDDRKPYPLALKAIGKAFELAPGNLHVVCELLRAQAKEGTPKLADTLEQVRPLLEPLGPSVKKRTRRFDLNAAIDRAIDGAKNGKTVYARQIVNVLNPELPKRIDQRIIDKNLLEYVAVDFPEGFYEKAKAAGYTKPQLAAIDVKFEPTAEQLPDLSGITDMHLADMNLDAIPDVVVVRNGNIEIYARKSEEGTATGPWTQIAAVEAAGATHICIADLDRDYENSNAPQGARTVHEGTGVPMYQEKPGYIFMDTDPDIIAFGPGGVSLFRNDRTRDEGISFERTLNRIEVKDETLTALKNVADVAVIDVEHDGDLDLVSAAGSKVTVWVNHSTKKETVFVSGGDMLSGVPDGETITSLTPIDWNRDIALDLMVATDKSVGLFQNVLHSRFRWRDLGIGSGASVAAIGDFNGDAAWDVLLGTNEKLAVHLLSSATIEGTTWAGSKEIDGVAGAIQLCDYDNDTYLDAVVCGGKTTVLRGGPNGTFTPTDIASETPGGTVCGVADLDLDGDQDLVVAGPSGVRVFDNKGGNKNNWFRLTLRPEPNPEQFPASRVNVHALGSVVELKSGSRYQAQTVAGLPMHFGLGDSEQADVVRIIWTDGVPQNLVTDPAPKKATTVLAPQYLGGSCPYIYTWTGEKFEFYSDCLWAAPLGLQFGEGIYAPSREWEYLKIDGDALKPRDGEYVLKITEELWEATYLDNVKLIAVDHPKGTDIFSNEKVGPPNVTDFRIHTVREPRLPVSAKNQNGRDLLPSLKAKDKDYVAAFDRRIKQGLTTENFIEFDLGELENAEQVTLFMVGWVFPTDTNINIGIEQAGEAPPKPPSIQVPDENGNWVEAIPAAGFPGGKTKTIAFDLSGAFKTNDYRVRLVSSMELYWDAAFFTVGPQEVQVQQTEVPLLSANLRFRGFSKRKFEGSVFTPGSFGPEDYDYYDVSASPTWLPMDGHFTKFGDVLPLLTERDDMHVVFGAGDEVTLTFDANQSPVSEGWVRDFLLFNVGWDKDVKQNTVYGSTVEPLPYGDMKAYSGANTEFPQSDKHRGYLKTWQTRTQNLKGFRNWVREFDTSQRKSSQ